MFLCSCVLLLPSASLPFTSYPQNPSVPSSSQAPSLPISFVVPIIPITLNTQKSASPSYQSPSIFISLVLPISPITLNTLPFFSLHSPFWFFHPSIPQPTTLLSLPSPSLHHRVTHCFSHIRACTIALLSKSPLLSIPHHKALLSHPHLCLSPQFFHHSHHPHSPLPTWPGHSIHCPLCHLPFPLLRIIQLSLSMATQRLPITPHLAPSHLSAPPPITTPYHTKEIQLEE